jgi:hypothetical protein
VERNTAQADRRSAPQRAAEADRRDENQSREVRRQRGRDND